MFSGRLLIVAIVPLFAGVLVLIIVVVVLLVVVAVVIVALLTTCLASPPPPDLGHVIVPLITRYAELLRGCEQLPLRVRTLGGDKAAGPASLTSLYGVLEEKCISCEVPEKSPGSEVSQGGDTAHEHGLSELTVRLRNGTDQFELAQVGGDQGGEGALQRGGGQ